MSSSPSSSASSRKRLGRPPSLDNPQERILEAAATLFAERGYETSSLSDLAGVMKMSKASIYHYFATKQEIYDAIILKTQQGLLDAVRGEVEAQASPALRLRAFMAAHGRYFEQHRAGFVAMLVGFCGMTHSEFRDEALRLRDTYEQMLRDIVADGVAERSFRPVDAVTTARAVLSMLNWLVRWFKPDGGKSAEQIALEYHELLIGGLLPQAVGETR